MHVSLWWILLAHTVLPEKLINVLKLSGISSLIELMLNSVKINHIKLKDYLAHPLNFIFELLPSGKRLRSSSLKSKRYGNANMNF